MTHEKDNTFREKTVLLLLNQGKHRIVHVPREQILKFSNKHQVCVGNGVTGSKCFRRRPDPQKCETLLNETA